MLLPKIQMMLKMYILIEAVFTVNICYILLYKLYHGSVMLLDCIYVFKILKYF